MANNTTLNPGVNGDVICTEDIAGVKYPVSKVVIGNFGSIEGDVSSSRPLPIVVRNSLGDELSTATNPLRVDPTGTTTQPISGTVTANAGVGTFVVSAASLPLPTGAAQ